MRRPGPLVLLAFGAIALAACGSSGPKRTVDARAEALRFFPADTPLVALLDTTPQIAPERTALAGQLSGITPWERIRSGLLARLAAAGIPAGALASLLRSDDSESVGGLPASQLAVGLAPGSGPVSRVLAVLVTDKPDEMRRLFARAAASGPLRAVGREDEAGLYSSARTSFAVRDGVMLAADDPGLLRTAIERRDGTDDNQLDDGEVKSLIDELPREEPLEVYADLTELRHDDPNAAAMARAEPAIRALGKTAASLGPRRGGPVLDLFSKLEPSAAGDQVLPEDEGRASFSVSSAAIRRAFRRAEVRAGRVGRLSISAAPLAAALTVTGDELRAKLRLSP